MALNPETKYPNRRTYVLKLRGDARPGALVGRIENFITGHQREFSGESDLIRLLAVDLADPADGGMSGGDADADQTATQR